jgi:FkbM family methyltransferase
MNDRPDPGEPKLRRVAFVLAASEHGPMIVNRLDFHEGAPGQGFGVGFEVLETGAHAGREVEEVKQVLAVRRAHHGDGVVAVDCGANIGCHTVSWARYMTGWGSVIAIEAQERIFYALAGNISLNNCWNARAIHAAVGAVVGRIGIPVPDYQQPASFGSLELRQRARTEFIGQTVDYAPENLADTRALSIDSLDLPRRDLLKIDVEGMEADVLEGAAATLARTRPIILAEYIKSGWDSLAETVQRHGYQTYRLPLNLVAIHPDDPAAAAIKFV